MSPQDDQQGGGSQGETASVDQGSIEEPKIESSTFHVFTKRQKWIVVCIIGAAGLFSGLSSNIYFPSLHAITEVCGLTLAFARVPQVRGQLC